MGGQSTIKVTRTLGIAAVLAVLLAGCTNSPGDRFVSLPMPKAPAPSSREPAVQRSPLFEKIMNSAASRAR